MQGHQFCTICKDILNGTEIQLKCTRCESSDFNLKSIHLLKSPFYILRGTLFLFKHPVLLLNSILPILLTLIFLCFFIYEFVHIIIIWIDSYFETLSLFERIIEFVVFILSSLLGTFIAYWMFLPLISLISIPFIDRLSVKTEELLLGQQVDTQTSSTIFVLKEMLKLGLFKALVLLISSPLLFIPGPGQLGFILITTLLTSIDFFDMIMSRKNYTFSQKEHFIRSNFIYFILFSIFLFPMALIPVLQFLIIPATSVGSVIFFIEAKSPSQSKVKND